MKRTNGVGRFFIFAACIFAAHSALAVVPGQVDDFENGTTMGWAHGVPGYLLNINTGGPAGADDNYLQLRADGDGSGGRLTTFNLQQWLGNYVGQGITTIEIDLINLSSVNLSIRLAYKSQNHQTAPGYMSQAMLLPVGSGWQHFSISLTAASMIPVGGPAPFNTFFTSGVQDARIINAAGTSNLNGDFVVGMLGIDNIRAVPEPTTTALVAGGLLLLAFRRLRLPGK